MDRRKIQLDRVPGDYFKVVSGLGEATRSTWSSCRFCSKDR
jgi:hypothetical protein